MATAIQDSANSGQYASNYVYPTTPNFTKSNDFLKELANGSTNRLSSAGRSRSGQSSQKSSRRGSLGAFNPEEHSFFDFEVQSGAASPFQDQFPTPGASNVPSWAVDSKFNQPLSPPDSAILPFQDWAYEYQNSVPGNILTDIQTSKTFREQYGQVTPPDDDAESLFDNQLREQTKQKECEPLLPPLKKRQRSGHTSSKTTVADQPPPKRTRKYAARLSSSSNSNPASPPDVRRSKFLERNRVAASKCRQKKKEWTQNLETRARELQKNNNNLRIMIQSLHEELFTLKEQCAEHSDCGCEAIQQIMKDSTHDKDDFVKQEHVSPVGSAPHSRGGSVDASISSDHCDEEASRVKEIVDDEHTLEALLTCSIKHDTSEEGIAHQVHG